MKNLLCVSPERNEELGSDPWFFPLLDTAFLTTPPFADLGRSCNKQEGYRLKSARSYASSEKKIHPKDFLAISENFEKFHIELASQPMLSHLWGGGELNMVKK